MCARARKGMCSCSYQLAKRGCGSGSGLLQKGESLPNGFTDLHKI